jgi:hypothetical protein
VGGGCSRSRASLPEPCELDLLLTVWHAESVQRTTMDCFSVELHLLNLLDKDCPLRPQGKKRPSCSNLKIERSRLWTWCKLGTGFFLALGRAVRNLLDRFAGSGLSCKSSGFRVARLMPKAKVSRPSSSTPETTSKVSTALILVRPPPRGLEVAASVATEGAGPAISVSVGGSIRSEPSSSAVTGTTLFMPSTGGESSNVHTLLLRQTPASKESSEGMGMVSSGSFGFCHPPLPAPELLLPVAPIASQGSVSLLVGSELNSSPVSSSSLVTTVPSVQAFAASSFHVSANPVEEKKSVEDPSRISELSTGSTLGEKVRDAVYWWRKEVSKLQEKKDQPIVCDQNWEKDCWRIEAELWGKIFEVYPWATKEQRQKHREIWGETIENKKRESKRELRNLQSSVNYGNIRASSRCRRDKANRSWGWLL